MTSNRSAEFDRFGRSIHPNPSECPDVIMLNKVVSLCMMGNTYPNLDAIKATGARWDNGAHLWTLNVRTHPMNNVKQRKKLEAALTALEERGVQFVLYYEDGEIGS